LETIATQLRQRLAIPRYLSHRDLELWRASVTAADQTAFRRIASLATNPLLPQAGLSPETKTRIDVLADVITGPRDTIKRRNERFVAREITRGQQFFDRVEKTPLTPEQRVASVVFEDRNLLVAAAGSGKTSTIVGKIGYSLLTKQYQPKDFLVLAFNNDAAGELDERINTTLRSLLPAGERIKARTFHGLGMDILAAADGRKPSVANLAGGGEGSEAVLIEGLIQDCLQNDPGFAINWLTFRAVCFKAAANPLEFDSLEAWNTHVRINGDQKNGKRGFLTLQGEIVKSQGELAIANWLSLQGVTYAYEHPYEYDTATEAFSQYRPDFYLPDIKTYLEHYALDANGRPPVAFGERYAESMQWKAQLHAEKATALITTTFAEFVSGALFPKLEKELRTRGQRFSPRPIGPVLERLNERQKTDYGAFLRTALKHVKSNELEQATLEQRAEGSPDPFRSRLFVRILWQLFRSYQDRLKRAGEIDFEDMIVQATRAVTANRYSHDFKLILVDECQDLSQARAKLIKALLTQAPDCKLFAVGDDWQSIYRFAGADIDVFTHFADHFGVTATNYLTQTFRSNQGISNVAAAFIQKNPGQLRKEVQALDPTVDGVVVVRQYSQPQEMEDQCRRILDEIALVTNDGKRTSVFLLARYKFQRPAGLAHWNNQFPQLDLTFKTIHSSKGLQADHVIVLGLETGWYAFPSEIADDPLLQLVTPQAESFPNADERRLFYVALTRARHRVYLLGNRSFPSPFLKEIIEDEANRAAVTGDRLASVAPSGGAGRTQAAVEACPACSNGTLRKRSGQYGEFFGCSNYPDCRYIRKLGN
jgi:DNA helicase-4